MCTENPENLTRPREPVNGVTICPRCGSEDVRLGKEAFIAHCRATAMKYIWRTGKKDDAVQDMNKAIWYLQRAVEELRE